MSYSPRGIENAPKVAVSTTSTPAAEELIVHVGDDIGPGDGQDLVASLEVGSAEGIFVEVERLHVGAECAVEDEHPFPRQFAVGPPSCSHGVESIDHRPLSGMPGRYCSFLGRSGR